MIKMLDDRKETFSISVSRTTYILLQEMKIKLYRQLREDGLVRNVGFDEVISNMIIEYEKKRDDKK